MTFYLTYVLVATALFAFTALFTLFAVYSERTISAFIQDRLGPMEVGKYGMLQAFADILKMLQNLLILATRGKDEVRCALSTIIKSTK